MLFKWHRKSVLWCPAVIGQTSLHIIRLSWQVLQCLDRSPAVFNNVLRWFVVSCGGLRFSVGLVYDRLHFRFDLICDTTVQTSDNQSHWLLSVLSCRHRLLLNFVTWVLWPMDAITKKQSVVNWVRYIFTFSFFSWCIMILFTHFVCIIVRIV